MWPEGEPDEDTFGVNGEAKVTFNKKDKVAEKKPFQTPKPINITQVIADKLEKRDEERCTRCGHLKVKISSRHNLDGAKFVMRCTFCANKRRNELRAEKRNGVRADKK